MQKTPSEDYPESFRRYEQIHHYFGLDSIWYLQKICNVVTLDREYQALHSIYDLYLKETLINPASSLKNIKIGNFFSIPEKLELKLKDLYNQSQLEAIKATLKKEGVTLIQGPPGTGKTTTVLGTISVLLNSLIETREDSKIIKSKKNEEFFSYQKENSEILEKENKKKPWLMHGFKDWYFFYFFSQQFFSFLRRDEFGEDIELNSRSIFYPSSQKTDNCIVLHNNKTKNAAPPEKILICAPSNAAIDEIVRKILEKGF